MFDNLHSRPPPDPNAAARRSMRARRRRFYREVTVVQDAARADGSAIVLDGRPVRTPARHVLAAPTVALAEAIAGEWRRQGEFIDPAAMPLTRLANTIIDGVTASAALDEVAGEVGNYLGSDLLCYRATGPQALRERQSKHWDPLLAWAREVLGADFAVIQGLVHVAQPDAAIARASAAIPRHPWRLGAVHAITTLTGSALIALALDRSAVAVEAAWEAAHVDEDWNMELWGRDELALARRRFRHKEMMAAAHVLAEPIGQR